MGNLDQPQMLVARWNELIDDPSLQDLPYRIELNAEGKIEMSPAKTWHGRAQARIATQLNIAKPDGECITECGILTEIGVRVPDVVWASSEFLRQHDESPLLRAPEICVEVASRSNSARELDEKVNAYLAAGATEVWIVTDAGALEVYGAEGRRGSSEFGVTLDLPPNPNTPNTLNTSKSPSAKR